MAGMHTILYPWDCGAMFSYSTIVLSDVLVLNTVATNCIAYVARNHYMQFTCDFPLVSVV